MYSDHERPLTHSPANKMNHFQLVARLHPHSIPRPARRDFSVPLHRDAIRLQTKFPDNLCQRRPRVESDQLAIVSVQDQLQCHTDIKRISQTPAIVYATCESRAIRSAIQRPSRLRSDTTSGHSAKTARLSRIKICTASCSARWL